MNRIFFISLALCLSLGAAAQNLNPTVEVSNQYEGKTVEVSKPQQKMFVPDSLYKFDLKLDYSVFEQKYAGAGDFAPYLMDMKPVAHFAGQNRFYLKAGAGYSLKPVLELVYSPVLKNGLTIDFFANHNSYIGDYWSIAANGQREDAYVKGRDMDTWAGMKGRKEWRRSVLNFGLAYKGIHTAFDGIAGGSNMADVSLGLVSNGLSRFTYNNSISLKFGANKNDVNVTPMSFADADYRGSFKYGLSGAGGLQADAHIQLSTLGTSSLSVFSLAPHYAITKNRFRLLAGIQVAVTGGDASDLRVFPDVRMDVDVVKEHLNFYLSATGQSVIGSLPRLQNKIHFLMPFEGLNLQSSVENLRVAAGIRGNILTKFKYDINGGYLIRENWLGEGLERAGLAFEDYVMAYLNFWSELDLKSFVLDASLRYRYTVFPQYELEPGTVMKYSLPEPEFSGMVRALYNLEDRLRAGVYGEFASQRQRDPAAGAVPAFFNLGLTAEYAFTKKLSFWLRADNLLNQTIQRNPLIAERGVCVTAGVILNL